MTVYRVVRASDTVIADTDGQVSTYDEADDRWEPREPAGGGGAVDSVNGQTGAVALSASDVGAAPATHYHDARYVRTVNGTGPDGSGNVVVSGGGGSGLTEDPANPGLYLIGTAPTTITVTATAPTFTDEDGTASDTYTIPATTGVEYLVGGVVQAAGTYPASGTITVTAQALPGYTLTGTSSWSHTFSTGTAPVPVTANPPTADDTANTITWAPKTGVEYVIDGQVRTPPYSVGDVDATVTVTAQATNGYTLTGTSSWTFTFTETPTTPATPAQDYADAVMSDAPVVFYKLDEAAGVTPVDSMGNSTATVLGGVTLGAASILTGATSAQIASAITDGNAIAIGKPSALNNLTAWTFEMIIRAEGDAGGVLNRSDAETNPRISWTFDGTPKYKIQVDFDNYIDAEQSFAWFTPQHIAATYDGTTIRLYTNGVEVHSATRSGWNSGNPTQGWEIGRQDSYSGGRGSYRGRMAGVALYDKALTAAQVLAHAQAAGLAV